MLLTVDVGNSNISVGVFDENDSLLFQAKLDTDRRKTADQFAIDLMNLFTLYGYDIRQLTGAIYCSVVPPLNFMLEKALMRLLRQKPLAVGPGLKTGLNIKMEIHAQLGADIVTNAVSALKKYPTPIIVIDMGTATTIACLTDGNTYEGGLLYPGVSLSLDALSSHTAQLPAISLRKPRSLIGKNTEDCMCSGIVYGTAGMLDGIVERISETLGGKVPTVVATGGNAPVIVKYCKTPIVYDKNLLLEGLCTLYRKNSGG